MLGGLYGCRRTSRSMGGHPGGASRDRTTRLRHSTSADAQERGIAYGARALWRRSPRSSPRKTAENDQHAFMVRVRVAMARRNRTAHDDGYAESPARSRLRARNPPHDTTVPAGHRSRTTSTLGRSRAPPFVPCPRADRPNDARHSRRARMSARIARTRGVRSLKRLPVPLPPHPGSQLLGHNDTEILEGSERSMELLQGVVGSRVAKCVNEELRVQNVLADRPDHGSRSGDAISTPSMARVPSTSSR